MAIRIIQDGGGRHLEFVRTGNSAIRSAVPENHTLEQNMKWIGRPVAEISPLEIFPTWRWPQSWICSNRKSRRSIRRPRNPTLEPNMKWIGSPVAEIWPFAYVGGILNPHFGEGEVVGVSDGTTRKSDGSFLWALHCDR